MNQSDVQAVSSEEASSEQVKQAASQALSRAAPVA